MTDRPNRELAAYVLSILGGESRPIHTEDIAVKCHELFPASFSWTKYPDIPDKDIVRVALIDARKERYGGLVNGRAGEKRGHFAKTKRDPAFDGWMLTEAGIRWVAEHRDLLESLVGARDVKSHRQKVLKELARIRLHPLFRRYVEDPHGFAPSIGDVADFVRCRVDAPENVWTGRFDSIQKKAIAGDQEDLIDFVKKCRSAYLAQR